MNVSRDESGGAWDMEVDVVIVGAGDAGLAAAIEAAGAGADTVVFERLATLKGSSSTMSGGVFAFAGTDLQQRQGIQDSDDLFYKDLMDVGKWKNDQKLVQTFIKNQLDTYYWLTEIGVEWDNSVRAYSGMSVPRCHATGPDEHVEILKEAAENKGVRVIFKTRVIGLLTDEEKRVIGVRAESGKESQRVKARRGVVLATGGFGWDSKRLEAIAPRLLKVNRNMGPGHTGDGHNMAEELGAFFKDMEYIKPSFGIHVTGKSVEKISIMYFRGAIIVNKKGERFVNEAISYKDIGVATLAQPNAIGIEIFDQKLYEAAIEASKKVLSKKVPLGGLSETTAKLLVKANTIEELASKIGVPPEALKKTIDQYNSYVDGGKDLDFGRTTLTWGVGKIIGIDASPFYAYESKPFLSSTFGGIVVSEDMHVLTKEGKIPGLYGAGEIIGGVHGAAYHTGSALSKAVVFGRITGRNVAHER